MSEGDGGVFHVKLFLSILILANLNAVLYTWFSPIPIDYWLLGVNWFLAIGIDAFTLWMVASPYDKW